MELRPRQSARAYATAIADTITAAPRPFVGAGALSAPLQAAAAVLVVVLVAFALAFGAFTVGYQGRIYPGVIAAGVPVGGLAPDQAAARLGERGNSLGASRAELRAGDVTWQPRLDELGLGLEGWRLSQDALAVGRAGPLDRIDAFLHAPFRTVEVGVPSVNRRAIDAWIVQAAAQFDRPAVDARLELLADGTLRLTPESAGRRLDRVGASQQMADALGGWLAMARPRDPVPSIEVPFQTLQPAVTASMLEPIRAESDRVLGRPVTLQVQAESVALDRAQIASLVALRPTAPTPRLEADTRQVADYVASLAGKLDRAPVDAMLTVSPDGAVSFRPDVAGRRLDRAAAQAALASALFSSGTGPISLALPTETIPAALRAAGLTPVRTNLERLLVGPVELTAGEARIELPTAEVASALRLRIAPGQAAAIEIDAAKLKPRVEELASRTARAPRNARLRVVGGQGAKPDWAIAAIPAGGAEARLEAIEEGVDGQRLDVAPALQMIAAALARGERQVALPLQVLPALKSSDQAAFGPLELIDAGTTAYGGSIPERAHNVELAASRLDGVIVAPGETFSFNAALGPTTIDTGFQWAWGIDGGGVNGAPRTVPSVGGGICQVATTLFHAVFWSGYQVEERNWHLYWIPKYGAGPRGLTGLDATVDEDSGTDFKWTNTSDHPVLIQARTDGSQISFALHGQRPSWEVAIDHPIVGGVRPAPAGTVTETTTALPAGRSLWIEEARDGFTSTIVRTVTAPGAEPRVLRMTSTYQPSRNVLLVGVGG